MLRVIWPTSRSVPARWTHSVSPTRMTTPLPRRAAVSDGSASRGCSPFSSASARSASVTSWPSAVTSLPPRACARLGLLEPAEGVDDAVGAGQQAERGVVGERGQRQRAGFVDAGAAERVQARPEGVRRRRLRGLRQAVRTRRAPRGAGCRCRSSPAGRRPRRSPRSRRASERPTQRSGPARITPSRSVARGSRERVERDVGGEVVADARAVEEDEQRRGLVGEGGRHPLVAGDHARPLHRAAGLERVGQAVAVVVDLVDAEPRDGRDHDQQPRPLGRLDEERDAGAVAARAHLQQVGARLCLRGADGELAARRPGALLDHVGDPDPADAPAVRAPARVDEELDALRRRARARAAAGR